MFGLALASVVAASLGQSLSERSEAVTGDAFLSAFLGHCAQNAGNIERVSEAAEALGYSALPQMFEPLVAPQNPDAEFEGFLVTEGEGAPYLLGISAATEQGELLHTCSVANPFLPSEQLESAVDHWHEIGDPDEEQVVAGQRYRIWFVNHIADRAFVGIVDATPMGMPGATISITAPSLD